MSSSLSKYSYVTSKSRIEEGNNCERSRWWGHDYKLVGLEKTGVNLALHVGGCVHKGVEVLMQREVSQPGVQKIDLEPTVEVAVRASLEQYDQELRERKFNPEDLGESEGDEGLKFVYEESKALIEALVRVFQKEVLPRLVERYEVLEVEHDAIVKLVGEVGFRFIPDALLRERGTRDLYVFSLKTAKEWNDRLDESARMDAQGLSETWGSQVRRGEKVLGVQMCYLLKGQRKKSKRDGPAPVEGTYYQDSSLLHVYRQAGVMPEDDRFSTSVYYECQEPHEVVFYQQRKGKSVRVEKHCEGMARHKRAGEWSTCNTWEITGGIARWIARLAAGENEFGSGSGMGQVLEQSVVLPSPYYRGEQEIADWLEQTSYDETWWSVKAKVANEVLERHGEESKEMRRVLNRLYKQDRSRCQWGVAGQIKCQFIGLCHEGVRATDGVYELRRGKTSEKTEVL